MPTLISINTCSRVDMKKLSACEAQTTCAPHTVRHISDKLTLRCFTKITEFLNCAEGRCFLHVCLKCQKPSAAIDVTEPMNDVLFHKGSSKAKREVPSRAKKRLTGWLGTQAPYFIRHSPRVRRQTRIVRCETHMMRVDC